MYLFGWEWQIHSSGHQRPSTKICQTETRQREGAVKGQKLPSTVWCSSGSLRQIHRNLIDLMWQIRKSSSRNPEAAPASTVTHYYQEENNFKRSLIKGRPSLLVASESVITAEYSLNTNLDCPFCQQVIRNSVVCTKCSCLLSGRRDLDAFRYMLKHSVPTNTEFSLC